MRWTGLNLVAFAVWGLLVSKATLAVAAEPDRRPPSVQRSETKSHSKTAGGAGPSATIRPTATVATPDADRGQANTSPATRDTGEPQKNRTVSGQQRDVRVTVTAPAERSIDSSYPFEIQIENIGEEIIDEVVISAWLPEPLRFPGSDERGVQQRLYDFEPGETKVTNLALTGTQTGSGDLKLIVRTGDGPPLVLNAPAVVVPRQLVLSVIGPEQRHVGSRAEFNVQLVNLDRQTVRGVRVRLSYDSSLVLRELTTTGRFSDEAIVWELGDLAGREGVQLQAEFDCPVVTSQTCVRVDVTADNLPTDNGECCLEVIPVVSPLRAEIRDLDDPVQVGRQAELVIPLVNRGLRPLHDVTIEIRLPEPLEFVSAEIEYGSGNGSSAQESTAESESERTLRGKSKREPGNQSRSHETNADTTVPLTSLRSGRALLFAIPERLDVDAPAEFRLRVRGTRPGLCDVLARLHAAELTEPVDLIEPLSVHY